MTVQELKTLIEESGIGGDAEVRFISQPGRSPLEYQAYCAGIVEYEESDRPCGVCLYLVEGDQVGYFGKAELEELGY